MGSRILLFLFRGVIDEDPTMTMLVMTILVRFWLVLGHCTICTQPKVQSAALNCSLANRRMLGQSGAWSGPCVHGVFYMPYLA